MTNKELLEKINCLETELVEIKEMVEMKGADGDGLFKPEHGQGYWLISDSGNIHRNRWDTYKIDQNRYSIGNCFSTRQEAEDAVRVLKLIQKARESQNGFVPDWEDGVQAKYSLNFHMGDIGISDYYFVNLDPTFGFWKDESVCEQFIEDNHDELLWYFKEYGR